MTWLSRGSRGNHVRNVQGLLWQAGLYDGQIDGRYGPMTERAVRTWQKEIGAVSDGNWGIKTIDATSDFLAKLNNEDALQSGNRPVVPNFNNQKGMG